MNSTRSNPLTLAALGGLLVLALILLLVPSDLRAPALALALIAGLVVLLFAMDEIRTQEKARQRGQRVKPLHRRIRYVMQTTPARVLAAACAVVLLGAIAWVWLLPDDADTRQAELPRSAAAPARAASAASRLPLPMPTASVPVPTVTVPITLAAPAVAAAAPAAVAAPPAPAVGGGRPSGPSPDLGDIDRAVRTWASAWSAQNVEAYLAAYSPDFVPASGVRRDQWVQQRRERIGKARNPQVSLDRMVISTQGPDTARVQFQQRYQASGMDETISKTLAMVRAPDGCWLIRSEVAGSSS